MIGAILWAAASLSLWIYASKPRHLTLSNDFLSCAIATIPIFVAAEIAWEIARLTR